MDNTKIIGKSGKEINLIFKDMGTRYQFNNQSLSMILKQCYEEEVLNTKTIIKIVVQNKSTINTILTTIKKQDINIDIDYEELEAFNYFYEAAYTEVEEQVDKIIIEKKKEETILTEREKVFNSICEYLMILFPNNTIEYQRLKDNKGKFNIIGKDDVLIRKELAAILNERNNKNRETKSLLPLEDKED